MKKKWLVGLLALALSCAVVGFVGCGEEGNGDNPSVETPESPEEQGELAYRLIDGGAAYEVSGIGSCTATDVVIPATYNGLPVTSIGEFAFKYSDRLTSVEIPEGITEIKAYAFHNSSELTSVELPDGVTTIGTYAFADCSELTNISIPDSITSIGVDAFFSDNKLVYTTHDNAKYLGNANNAYAALISKTDSSIASCTIHEDTKVIAGWAFAFCKSLTSIEIPDGVVTLDNKAFTNCETLSNIVIPDSVTSIGFEAFFGCKALSNIAIPDSVVTIGNDAFENCSELTSVTFSHAVPKIGENAFYGCDKLQYYTNDNGKYLADADSLYSILIDTVHTSFSNFTIHNDTKAIAGGAFAYCDRLTAIEIPKNVRAIGYNAFVGCTDLGSITVHADNAVYKSVNDCLIETASKTLVAGCKTSVIPDDNSVTSIAPYAFADSGLTSVTIPESVYSIGDYAFNNCDDLTGIVIPDSVIYLGEYAFYDCNNLTSVTVGDWLDKISTYAFASCGKLTSVVIGDSVVTIAQSAFEYCSDLTDVYYVGTSEAWAKINVKDESEAFASATVYYYSESEQSGCWHYDENGAPTKW